MRKKLVAKIKAGTHALEFDNRNVEQLRELDIALGYNGGVTLGEDEFIFTFNGSLGLLEDEDTPLPTIKLSKIFKLKKVKKPSIESRVSRLEKALEIENSLIKAVAKDFDKPFTKSDAIEIPDEIAKEVQWEITLKDLKFKDLEIEMLPGDAPYRVVKYRGIDKPVVEEL